MLFFPIWTPNFHGLVDRVAASHLAVPGSNPGWALLFFLPFFQTFRAYNCFQLRVAKLGPWYIENICIEEALISIPTSYSALLTLKIKYGKVQF